MGFGFKQPLVGEKRVTTLITAAKETTIFTTPKITEVNKNKIKSKLK